MYVCIVLCMFVSLFQITKLLKSADNVCTTTASHEPLFNSDIQVNPEGCHFNSVGSFTKDMRKLPK